MGAAVEIYPLLGPSYIYCIEATVCSFMELMFTLIAEASLTVIFSYLRTGSNFQLV